MRNENTRLARILVQPRLSLLAGGAGIDAGLLRDELFLRAVVGLVGADDAFGQRIRSLLRRAQVPVLFDSDEGKARVYRSGFVTEEQVVVEPPANYRPLTSPSGRAILDRIDEPPFVHLKEWERLEAIKDKSSSQQAEGVPLFGAANAGVNIRRIRDEIRSASTRLKQVVRSDIWLDLAALGFTLSEEIRIDSFTSTGGGQGAGEYVFLQVLTALDIEDIRERVKIHCHVLLPGFHEARNDAERIEQCMKTQAFFENQAAMKVEGRGLEIPFPGGALAIEPSHAREIFDYVDVYKPQQSGAESYEAFITRVARTVLVSEISALASNIRTMQSNANSLAYRTRLRVVGGSHD